MPLDAARARKLFERACHGGEWKGCTALGVVYAGGIGVPKDDARAVGYYRLACHHDQPAACSNLGTMFAGGRGVPADGKAAQRSFARACELGYARGCTALGIMDFRLGDKAGAVAAFRRGCHRGDKLACGALQKLCAGRDHGRCGEDPNH